MDFPDDLRYTTADEWVRMDGDEATIGITEYAQDQLGDVVYLELPASGRSLVQDEAFGVIESVKAVSDLMSPLAGEVIARNDALVESPELVNTAPYGDGWMIKLRTGDRARFDGLMSAAEYRERLPQE